MGGTEVLHEDRKLRVTSRKNLVIAVWSAVPEVVQLRALNRVLERFSKSKQGAYGIISAVVRGVPRFHQEDCVLIRFMPQGDTQKMPVAEAREAGCTPCTACQPEG